MNLNNKDIEWTICKEYEFLHSFDEILSAVHILSAVWFATFNCVLKQNLKNFSNEFWATKW